MEVDVAHNGDNNIEGEAVYHMKEENERTKLEMYVAKSCFKNTT